MQAIAFDFSKRQQRRLAIDDLNAARAGGEYCWVEVTGTALGQAPALLAGLGVDEDTVARIADDEGDGQFSIGRGCIHFTVVEVVLEAGRFRLVPLHVVLGGDFLVTLHRHRSRIMDGVLQTYEEDFLGAARSGGFLLFEVVDHLIDAYRRTLSDLCLAVEEVQSRLLGGAGDEVFTEVSGLIRSLLDFRKCVVAARETVHELATRRSPFVQQSTQPFLEKQTIPLERLALDAATERTVLSESLNLYMGIVSHRTNRVVNRLTIVSMIFLPLSFLAAVYGMNFDFMPELRWGHGYPAFWGACAVLVIGLLVFMKHKDWI